MWDSLMTFLQGIWHKIDWWVALGMLGQIIFAGRFVVQWLASERAGRSVVPYSFWTMSILGSVLVFVYALVRKDVVFILAYSLNVFIYVRNIMLIHRHRAVMASQPGGSEDSSPPA
jgi:lipid-A-disaccharide synthase-like uncharacterized protein